MRLLLSLLLLVTACLEPTVTVCSDGRTCGQDKLCDDVHDQCVTPEQLASCAAAADGVECNIVNDNDGVCDRNVCVFATCGDGYRKTSEACDGGANPITCESLGFYEAGPTACTAGCQIDSSVCVGRCGDGIVTEGREVCDVGIDPALSCVDFGYGAGVLGCTMCAPGIEDCKRFGWQYAPIAIYPRDLKGASDTSVFVVGSTSATFVADTGAAVFFDGTTWAPVDFSGCFSGAVPFLSSVWVLGEGDALIGSATGKLVHVTPSGCTLLPEPGTDYVNDIWAASASDIWVTLGATGGIAHFDGAAWTTHAGSFAAVWASSSNDVWTTVGTGLLAHYDGVQWTDVPVSGMGTMADVWGTSPTDIYVSGDAGGKAYVAHYNGVSWSKAFAEDGRWGSTLFSQALYGFSRAGHTYVVGHYAGTNVPRAFNVVDDGTGWLEPSAATAFAGPVWVSPAGTIYTTSSDSQYVASFGQDRFDTKVGSEGRGKRLAVRGNEVFAGSINNGGTYRWNGSSWVQDISYVPLTVGVGPNNETYGIDSYGSGSGDGLWLYTPGSGWQNTAPTETGHAISVAGVGDVWFVRQDNTLVQYAGTLPMTVHSSIGAVADVYAAAHDDIYAVGGAGIIQHYNGSGWTQLTSSTTQELLGVWGRSPTDIYAWGDSVLLHSDGATWTSVTALQDTKILDLWATSLTDIWVITEQGGVQRYNGSRWAPVDIGIKLALISIVGLGDSVYVTDVVDGVHRIVRNATWH